ncbi:methyltransferase domain-containing protein [Nodularia spumigena CS-588/01]|nr:methyltransferase domain-containing protein [Nodularia spumigena CS-588/01]
MISKEGYNDYYDHLINRLERDRQFLIPWIDNVFPLKNKKILEIGCGTGSSTVAFAEQGATVFGVDIHQGSINVSKDRLEIFGLDATLACANGVDIFNDTIAEEFDCIAYIAVLEHMTLQERILSLKQAWRKLPKGGYLIIQEIPNRLWYFDDHTSQENFFMWLPDELAILYSPFCRRNRFNSVFNQMDYLNDSDEVLSNLNNVLNDSEKTKLARWGRGISYHDFVLAFNIPACDLPVVSCMELFIRDITNTKHLYNNTPWREYENFLYKLNPNIHKGFYLKYLDLIFQKI